MQGMSAPDLGFDAFGTGASGSGAAAAPQTPDAGAAGQAAGTGVAPGAGQATDGATGVAGETGQTPGDAARMVPASDLDGLRSTYDRQLAEVRSQAQSALAERQQLAEALWQLQTANMSPDQRREAEAARAFQGQLGQLVNAAAAQQQQMQALEPVFKKMAVDEMTSQYGYAGVTRAELEQFNDPDVMETYCKALSARYNAARAQRQQPANQAAAGSGAAASGRNFAKMDMTELAKLAFG